MKNKTVSLADVSGPALAPSRAEETSRHPLGLETAVVRGLVQSSLPVVIFDAALRIVWANEAAGKISCGFPAASWRGRRMAEVLPGIDAGPIERSLRGVLETDRPAADLRVASRACKDSDGDRFWSCLQFPVRGPDGGPAGIVHVMWDVTRRAQDERRHALSDLASTRIGSTLDTTRTAEELLEVAVPCLADAAAVDLLVTVIDGDDVARQATERRTRLRRVAMRWAGQGGGAPAGYVRDAWLDTDPALLYHQRLVTGLPTFLPEFGAMSTEQLAGMDSGPGLRRMLAARAAGAHSLIVIPLMARGVMMGVAVFYRLGGSKPFCKADLSLAQDLVTRAGVAIDNARLYMRERASALALQRGLLPRQIPNVPGLDLAYRYLPAQTGAEAGGDWFDVITLGPARCALVVGDVTGHDIRAASVMGQLRTATRTLANLDLTPGGLLARLDQVATDLTDEETSATCVYAVHDASTAEWEIAGAGHPLPAAVSPGEDATFIDLPPGLPLGTGFGASHYHSVRVSLPRKSTLVLYTDGLIESRDADISTGMARLADTLTTISPLAVGQACDHLLTALAPNPADDMAALMART
jgi:PAS domain S-box-containing protein